MKLKIKSKDVAVPELMTKEKEKLQKIAEEEDNKEKAEEKESIFYTETAFPEYKAGN